MTRFGLFLVLLAACEIDVPLLHDPPKGQDAGDAGDAGGAGRSCQENEDCGAGGPSGLYCVKGFGGCRGPGVCEKKQPLRCAGAPNLAYVPVCGCDGVTYFNECLAAANGVPVERLGQCPPHKVVASIIVHPQGSALA